MELLQLRYFAAVVQEGTISGGAKKLGMTQPPVSTQIRLLEEELGCSLFARGSRAIRLTEEGRLLYTHARHILNMTESAAAAVSDCHDAKRGTLRIGVVSSLSDLAVKNWFAPFAQEHPLVNFDVYEGNTYELLDRLQSRVLDAALVRRPFSARGLRCVSLSPQDMLLMGQPAFLGSLPPALSLKQAAELPLILYRRWHGVLDQAFAAKGLKPRILCLADDGRTCMSWAAAGLGVAISPADMQKAAGAAGLTTRILRGLPPMAQTTLAIREDGCDTAVGKAFAQFFSDCCEAV
jgi:DNA-binding transcriptional LysR family regulator